MAKLKEKLTALKQGVETVSKKPQALSDNELELVTGGATRQFCPDPCDGSKVGNCSFNGNCPYTHKR